MKRLKRKNIQKHKQITDMDFLQQYSFVLKYVGICCQEERERLFPYIIGAVATCIVLYNQLAPTRKVHGLTDACKKLLTERDVIEDDCRSVCNALIAAPVVHSELEVLIKLYNYYFVELNFISA